MGTYIWNLKNWGFIEDISRYIQRQAFGFIYTRGVGVMAHTGTGTGTCKVE